MKLSKFLMLPILLVSFFVTSEPLSSHTLVQARCVQSHQPPLLLLCLCSEGLDESFLLDGFRQSCQRIVFVCLLGGFIRKLFLGATF